MKRRVLAILLTLAMVFSMLPVVTLSEDTTDANSGVVFTKTLIPATETQPAKIMLEAYATGSSSSTESKIPTDIVLVLDQSGSMDDRIGSQTKLEIMRDAVEEFVAAVAAMNNTAGDLYRVAIVGFASESGYSDNTEILTVEDSETVTSTSYEVVTGTLDQSKTYYIRNGYGYSAITYRTIYEGTRREETGWFTTGYNPQYIQVQQITVYNRVVTTSDVTSTGVAYNDLESTDYQSALLNCTAAAIGSDGLIGKAVAELDGNGATRTDLGLEMAANIFNAQPAGTYDNRSKVVVLITDGVPTTNTAFDNDVANRAVANAHDMKDAGAHVFSMYLGTPSSDSVNFLQAVSNNYPHATSITNLGEKAADKYYSAHSNAADIQAMFTGIVNTIQANTTLNENSIVTDNLTEYFKLAADIETTGTDQIEVYTVDKTAGGWSTEQNALTTATVAIGGTDNKTITVKGFDFAENCVTENPKGGAGSSDYGKKLVIYIPVVADSASNNFGGYLPTNAGAYIYQDSDSSEPTVTAKTAYLDMNMNYAVQPAERTYHVEDTLITEPAVVVVDFASIASGIYDEMITNVPDGTNNAGVNITFKLFDIGTLIYEEGDVSSSEAASDDVLVAELTVPVAAGTAVDVTDPALWTYRSYLAADTKFNITIPANETFAEKIFVLSATLTSADGSSSPATYLAYNYLDIIAVRGDLAHIVYGVIDNGGVTTVTDTNGISGINGSLVGNTYTEAVGKDDDSDTMTFTPKSGYEIASIRYLYSVTSPMDTAVYIYNLDENAVVSHVDLDDDGTVDPVSLENGSWSFTAQNVTSGVAVEVITRQITYTLTTSDDEGSKIISGTTYTHHDTEKLNVPFEAVDGYSLTTLEIDDVVYDLTDADDIATLKASYGAEFTYDGSLVVGGHVNVDRRQDHNAEVTSAKRSYQLTYQYYVMDADGQYDYYKTESAKTVPYGQTISPSYLPEYEAGDVIVISDDNYTLSEWFRNYTSTGLYGLIDLASATMPASDLVLHAVWTKNPSVKIADISIEKTVDKAYTADAEFSFRATYHEHDAGSSDITLAAGTTSAEDVMSIVLTDRQAEGFKKGNGYIYIYEVEGDDGETWIYDNTIYELRWENNGAVLYKNNAAVGEDTASFLNIRTEYDISIDKTVENLTNPGAEMAKTGDRLHYTITVHNEGNVPTSGITVTDTMTGAAGTVEARTYSSNVSYSGGVYTISSIAVGGSAVIEYDYIVLKTDEGKVIANTAAAQHEGQEYTDRTETTVEQQAVDIEKTVSNDTPEIGETITYSVAVKNTGNVVLNNVRIKDVMENAFGNIAFTPSSNISYDAASDTFTIAVIGVGATVTINYTYTVLEADAGKDIVNTAISENVPGEPSEEVVVDVESPDKSITITKKASNDFPKINEIVTYDIAVKNEGNVTVTDVKIQDTMTGASGVISTVALPTNVTYSGADRTFTVASIAPGAAVNFTYSYTVLEADAGKTIKNFVVVTSDPDTPSAEEEIKVEDPNTAVSIIKDVDRTEAKIGDTVTYRLYVTNDGNVTVRGIAVQDIMSGASGDISFTDTANVTYSAAKKTFTVAVLAPGGTETITYTYKVTEEDADAVISNVATVVTDPNNPSDEEEIKIEEADPSVSVSKTADIVYVKIGQTVNYTITVKNTGNVTLENTVIKDVMEGANGNISFKNTANVIYSAANKTFTISELAVGAAETIHYSYTAVEEDASKDIRNIAVAENIPDKPSDDVTVEVEDKDESIAIDKAVDTEHAEIGDTVTYTITVTNMGNVTVDDIVISDELTGAAGRIEFTDTERVTYNANEETFTVDTLAVQETLSFSYTYTVQEADAGKDITNTAVVTSDPDEPSDTEDVKVEDPYTNFYVDKSADIEHAKIGAVVTYTVQVTNRGNVSGGASVTLQDTMYNAAGEITFTDTDRVTYNESTNIFTVDSIAPEETVTFSYTYEILEEDAGKAIRNVIVVTNDPDQPGDSEEIEVEDPDTSVTVDKNVDKVYAKIGETITYTIQVKNVGNVTAEDIVISDKMSDAAGSISFAKTNNVTYNSVDSTFTIDTLAVGETETITYTYTVLEADAGKNIRNVAVAASDPDQPSDTEEVDIEDHDKSIYIDKSEDRGDARINDIITYTIYLRNDGNVTVDDIVIADKLINAAGSISFTDTDRVTYANGIFTVNTLAVGEELSFNYTYKVQEEDAGKDIINTAIVTSDPDQPSDTEEVDVEDPNTDFYVDKSADVEYAEIGQTITYTIVVKNRGNVSVDEVTLTDSLSGAAGKIHFKPADDRISYNAEEGIFTIDTLAVGEEITFFYTYEVQEEDAGKEIINNIVVTSDPDRPHDRDEVEIEDPDTSIAISKTADKQHAAIGETVKYTVEVTNIGNVTVSGIQILDILKHASGTIRFTDTENVTYDAGTNIFTIDSLGVKDKEVFSYTYTILETDAGNEIHNTVVVTSDPDKPTDTEEVEVEDPENEVIITKTVDQAEAAVGDVLTYTIRVSNFGNVGLRNVTITDTLEGITFRDSGVVTYDEDTLTFTISYIPVNDTVEIIYTYEVTEDDTGSRYIENTAIVTSIPEQPEATTETPLEEEEEEPDTNTYTVTYYIDGKVYRVYEVEAGSYHRYISGPNDSNPFYWFTGWGDPINERTGEVLPVRHESFLMPEDNVEIHGSYDTPILPDPDLWPDKDPEPDEPEDPSGELVVEKTLTAPAGYSGPTTFGFVIYRAEQYGEVYVDTIYVDADDETTISLEPGEYFVYEEEEEVEGYSRSVLCSEEDYRVTINPSAVTVISFENVYVAVQLETEDHFAYIIGYPDGLVRPESNITRAEVATIFFRMLTDESRAAYWSNTNSFRDVTENDWFNNAVSTLANAGILNGYGDGTFRPNEYITRAELVKIATSFYGTTAGKVSAFSDTGEHWANVFINAAYDLGFIDGYGDGTFKPDQLMTRAETMKVINRALGRAPHRDHLHADMITWEDNMDTSKWYYAEVQEATNSHTYDWAVDEHEVWIDILPVRDWAALEKRWSDAYSR